MSGWDEDAWHRMVEEEHRKLVAKQSPAERARLEWLRRLIDDNVSLEAAWREMRDARDTPDCVLEAVIVSVHEHGLAALKTAENLDRFRRLDQRQRAELRRRISKMARLGQIGTGLPPPDPSAQRFAKQMENDPEFQRIWRPALDRFHRRTTPMARHQEGNPKKEK
jgi:hypothetical protein